MSTKAAGLLATLVSIAFGCGGHHQEGDPAPSAQLRAFQDSLRARLEAAVAADPVVTAVLAERAPVVFGIRARLIEELAAQVAIRYLDHVSVDMSGLKAHGDGTFDRKTFVGKVKVGGWRVEVDVGSLAGNLRAGTPVVHLRRPDLIDVDLPVDVLETEGAATLHVAWDSSGLVNLVCKDFELTRAVRGRVLAQRHALKGALRIVNAGERLNATPQFPDRHLRISLDLTPQSWKVVEGALRSQDEPGTCKRLMDPVRGLAMLRTLAAEGVNVRLPDVMFRSVSLPARVRKSVRVGNRALSLSVRAGGLHVDSTTLWSSATVEVQSMDRLGRLRAGDPPASLQPAQPSASSSGRAKRRPSE